MYFCVCVCTTSESFGASIHPKSSDQLFDSICLPPRDPNVSVITYSVCRSVRLCASPALWQAFFCGKHVVLSRASLLFVAVASRPWCRCTDLSLFYFVGPHLFRNLSPPHARARSPRRRRGTETTPQVKTDDSFTFARAIKRLRQAVEALGDVAGGGKATDGTEGEGEEGEGGGDGAAGGRGGGGGGVSLSLERKRAIVLIMKEAFKSYHLAWARSSIEPAFKVMIA